MVFGGLQHWIKGFTLPTFTLAYIVIFTVAAGTFLMSISLLSPNPDATRDVLPFATGLVGFLGGLVTAMFGSSQRAAGQEAERQETKTIEPNDQEQKP
jgi:hypothetical protein